MNSLLALLLAPARKCIAKKSAHSLAFVTIGHFDFSKFLNLGPQPLVKPHAFRDQSFLGWFFRHEPQLNTINLVSQRCLTCTFQIPIWYPSGASAANKTETFQS